MYRDESYGAGGGRLTKEAHDRAMRLNKGPLIGGHSSEVPMPKRRPTGTPDVQRSR